MKAKANLMSYDYDYIIIGSGFGGSVSALRLAEKGYKVLIIEKGKWYRQNDFAKTNWNLRKWLWMPVLGFYSIMKISFFRHVTILSGTGVGGGSLVYANTLPVPKSTFYKSGSWAGLADWETELKPYYQKALKMLGVSKNPKLFDGDLALQQLANEIGRSDEFEHPDVAIFFGKENELTKDPYFEGDGPDRSGCTFCGGCMTGCRQNAKNTLDKNYLFLAQKKGAEILAEQEVYQVEPIRENDELKAYRVSFRAKTRFLKKPKSFTSKGVIFSGGVLGSVKLLLKLQKSSLPNLSAMLGDDIRTNNETLLSVSSLNQEKDLSKGVAIGSLLHTDENSHLEVVRYAEGSGFWKLLHLPLSSGKNVVIRIIEMVGQLFKTNRLGGFVSRVSKGKKPHPFIPESIALTKKYSEIIEGKATSFMLETFAGIPSTAHILGGAVMGKDASEGVINKNNEVFGYPHMYVIDGSMISANPGVNPALSITAIAERAMDQIPDKK